MRNSLYHRFFLSTTFVVAVPAGEEAGFHWATRSGLTIAIEDVVAPKTKQAILDTYEDQADKVQHAEAFEVCEYGRRPSKEELGKLFPFAAQ